MTTDETWREAGGVRQLDEGTLHKLLGLRGLEIVASRAADPAVATVPDGGTGGASSSDGPTSAEATATAAAEHAEGQEEAAAPAAAPASGASHERDAEPLAATSTSRPLWAELSAGAAAAGARLTPVVSWLEAEVRITKQLRGERQASAAYSPPRPSPGKTVRRSPPPSSLQGRVVSDFLGDTYGLRTRARCASQPTLEAPCIVSTLTREPDGSYLLRAGGGEHWQTLSLHHTLQAPACSPPPCRPWPEARGPWPRSSTSLN